LKYENLLWILCKLLHVKEDRTEVKHNNVNSWFITGWDGSISIHNNKRSGTTAVCDLCVCTILHECMLVLSILFNQTEELMPCCVRICCVFILCKLRPFVFVWRGKGQQYHWWTHLLTPVACTRAGYAGSSIYLLSFQWNNTKHNNHLVYLKTDAVWEFVVDPVLLLLHEASCFYTLI
jgi:hypothetical protein